MKNIFLAFYLLLIFFIVSPTKAWGQTVIFTDNFNDNDFSDWEVQRNILWSNANYPCTYNGEPANWNISNGMLGIDIDSSPCVTEITPSELDLTNINSYEYEFDWNFRESTNMDRNVIFLWQNPNNWYDLKILNDSIIIQKVINGSAMSIIDGNGNYNFQNDETYHFKIFVSREKISVEVDGNLVINAQDNQPYIEGFKTIGLQASCGSIRISSSYFDNIIVRSIEETPSQDHKLNVPLMKQNDNRWKTEEYDHASKWSSKTTIQNWGCAMSSLAMVFNYHGINKMPDGSEVNPSTLNAWLKSQADGYIGDGIVNWIAGTRLAKILNQQFGSTKLEYSGVNGPGLDTAKSEIDAGNPSILQIDGHFLVGTGYTNDGSDLFINDPAYSYEKLSQHNASLLSTRKFTPSNTDLSYFMLSKKSNFNLYFVDENGQNIMNKMQNYEESIKSIEDENEKTNMSISTFSKPESGKYYIAVISPQFAKFDFQLFTYDKDANLSNMSQSGHVGSYPIIFEINYNKEGSSNIKQIVNWNTFKTDLTFMKSTNNLKSSYAYMRLINLVNYAQKATTNSQLRYANLIGNYLNLYGRYMTTDGKAYLTQELEALKANL